MAPALLPLGVLALWTLLIGPAGCLQCYSCKASGPNEMDANIQCLEKAYLESCDEFYNYYNDVEEELYDYYYNFGDEAANGGTGGGGEGEEGEGVDGDAGGGGPGLAGLQNDVLTGDGGQQAPGTQLRQFPPPGVVAAGAAAHPGRLQIRRKRRTSDSRDTNSSSTESREEHSHHDHSDSHGDKEEDDSYEYEYEEYEDSEVDEHERRGRGRGKGRRRGRGRDRGRGRGRGRGRSRDYSDEYEYEYEEVEVTTPEPTTTTTGVMTTAKPPAKPEHFCYSVTVKTGWETYSVEKGCKKIKYCKDALANKPEWAHPWNFCCDRSRCNVKLVKDKPQRVFGMGCRRTDDCIQGHNTRPVCPHFFKACPRISRSLVKMECRAQSRTMASVKGGAKYNRAGKEKKCYCSKGYFPKGPICTSSATAVTFQTLLCLLPVLHQVAWSLFLQ